jgi:signal recognition particle receptor subunit beta
MAEHLKVLQELLPPEIAKLAPPEVLVAVVLVVLTTLVLIAIKLLGKGKRGSEVVLAGPCNGGKTTLYMRLRQGNSDVATVASMTENETMCSFSDERGRSSAPIRVVDIPGHHSSKHKLERHLVDALAVVFVLDAADMSPHRTDAADLLYEVLFHPSVAKRRVPILIACNKMDLEDQAYSVDFIKRTLEKQLETMRRTKTARIGQDLAKHGAAGGGDKLFSFSDVRNKIVFGQISAITGNIKELQKFIYPLL